LGSYCPFPVFALATAHVAFQFVDRRRLSPAYNIERDGLVGVAAEAFDFEAKVAGVYKGRKPTVDVVRVRALQQEGLGPTAIAKSLGIGRASVYRALCEQTTADPSESDAGDPDRRGGAVPRVANVAR
jgi:Helix-turn-helix domain of resolvase